MLGKPRSGLNAKKKKKNASRNVGRIPSKEKYTHYNSLFNHYATVRYLFSSVNLAEWGVVVGGLSALKVNI